MKIIYWNQDQNKKGNKMKQIVKYRFMSIPAKITGDLRITIDQKTTVYTANFDGGKSTSITLLPLIAIGIIHPIERDENGRYVKQPWNPNDTISLTKYNLPLFVYELKQIYQDMKIPELYSYHGERLELNDELATKARRVFAMGLTTIEMVPIVITRDENTSLEGIRMKFNNENSMVNLTLNEMYSMIDQLSKLNVDMLTFELYKTYIANGDGDKSFERTGVVGQKRPTVHIDIEPKSRADMLMPEIDKSLSRSSIFEDI